MTHDITGIIRSLHTTAMNRCRERLDEAALRARDRIRENSPAGGQPPERDEDYGVTSILKKRHGL